MRLDPLTVSRAINEGLAYYDHEDRLMARLPARKECLWPDVWVQLPDGTTSKHAEVLMRWWRAGENVDIAYSWRESDPSLWRDALTKAKEIDREVAAHFGYAY